MASPNVRPICTAFHRDTPGQAVPPRGRGDLLLCAAFFARKWQDNMYLLCMMRISPIFNAIIIGEMISLRNSPDGFQCPLIVAADWSFFPHREGSSDPRREGRGVSFAR
jgi:hypothetical protein